MLSAGKWPGGEGNDKIKSQQIYVVNCNFNSVSFFMKKNEGNFFSTNWKIHNLHWYMYTYGLFDVFSFSNDQR